MDQSDRLYSLCIREERDQRIVMLGVCLNHEYFDMEGRSGMGSSTPLPQSYYHYFMDKAQGN